MDTAPVKLIVEKHADGNVPYTLGLQGVVVGKGDIYEDAVADVKSAIASHVGHAMKTISVCDLQKPTRSVVATGQNGQVANTRDDQRIAIVLGKQGPGRETVAVEISRSFRNEIPQRRTQETISSPRSASSLGHSPSSGLIRLPSARSAHRTPRDQEDNGVQLRELTPLQRASARNPARHPQAKIPQALERRPRFIAKTHPSSLEPTRPVSPSVLAQSAVLGVLPRPSPIVTLSKCRPKNRPQATREPQPSFLTCRRDHSPIGNSLAPLLDG